MSITSLIPWKREERKIAVKPAASDPFSAFQYEMNRLFDEFFNPGFRLAPFQGVAESLGDFSPCIDVTETEKAITVTAELPGMDDRDIEVSLAGNALTISGEKKSEKEDRGKNHYYVERSFGSFRRTVPLPCEIEADNVGATFNKGVLQITLPRKFPAEKDVKRIPVSVK